MRGITKNQHELLNAVLAGSAAPTPGDGGAIDFDRLLEALSWCPSKPAAHFSIRALQRRGFLEKLGQLQSRRGRLRVCFAVTEAGLAALAEARTGRVAESRPPAFLPELPGEDLGQEELTAPGAFLEVLED